MQLVLVLILRAFICADSGIDLTVLRCVFFRNWCGFIAAGVTVQGAWPFVGKVDETDFVRW